MIRVAIVLTLALSSLAVFAADNPLPGGKDVKWITTAWQSKDYKLKILKVTYDEEDDEESHEVTWLLEAGRDIQGGPLADLSNFKVHFFDKNDIKLAGVLDIKYKPKIHSPIPEGQKMKASCKIPNGMLPKGTTQVVIDEPRIKKPR